MKFLKITCILLIATTHLCIAQASFNSFYTLQTEPTKQITVVTNKLGINYKEDWNKNNKFRNSLSYSTRRIDQEFNNQNIISDNNFVSLENKFEFIKTINQKFKIHFSSTTAFNYQGKISLKNFLLLGELFVDYEINNKQSVKIGLQKSTTFGTPKILPYLKYNFKIGEKFNAELGFPESNISYSNNSRNLFYLNHYYEGNQYQFTTSNFWNNSKKSGKLDYSQVNTSMNYERKMDEKWKAIFKLGYSYNKEYNINSNALNPNIIPIQDGFSLAIGLQYKL